MTNRWKKAARPLGAAVLLAAATALAGCPSNTMREQSAAERQRLDAQTSLDDQLKAHSTSHLHHAGNPDARAIPSVDRMKTQTTNERGGTTYGLGSSVYSVIGSSGLHSHGLSSHLESKLSGAGFDGVRVFALDDMVILAASRSSMNAMQLDTMQKKLLSGTSGAAAEGPETRPGLPDVGTRTTGNAGTGGGNDTVNHDNLSAASQWVRDTLGNVKVYTLTDPAAVSLIDRIRARAGDAHAAPKQLSADIGKLLQLAMSKGKTR